MDANPLLAWINARTIPFRSIAHAYLRLATVTREEATKRPEIGSGSYESSCSLSREWVLQIRKAKLAGFRVPFKAVSS